LAVYGCAGVNSGSQEPSHPKRDETWIFRTYAGHTNVRASNEIYRGNLSRGQTGLSIAFDLPTQCGYSSDHPTAAPEIGKVGVPINTLDDFHLLFAEIPIDKINTSMTINATAMWLLSLYVALAEERGVDPKVLQGTTQNDIIKEYLARGTYIFPPRPSMRLIVDVYEHALKSIPRWNPSNICSYHLQEAGATPAQELAFALANAMALLDAIRERGISQDDFERCVGRVSFFVNAGIRFIEEMCKMRAFTDMWDELTRDRYGVQNAKYRLFRYGVQVNSLGLTEEQPENNAWRILLEALGVTLSRDARCRALQLPTWNEALSLPRPWDQQWSLRLQQVLAYETDLLEYPDLFAARRSSRRRSPSCATPPRRRSGASRRWAARSPRSSRGYMKAALVRSQADRLARINSGDTVIVGRNRWTEGLPSPLLTGEDGGLFRVDPKSAAETLEMLRATKSKRSQAAVDDALRQLREAAQSGANMMPPSIACARARVTTGEWADALRAVFGEYRPPTGVEGSASCSRTRASTPVRARTNAWGLAARRPAADRGRETRGSTGTRTGPEMIAVAARHAGFEVIYGGIRWSVPEIVRSAVDEDANVLGLSVLSGAHLEIAREVKDELARLGGPEIPVVVGGIIPDSDVPALRQLGVRAVFTPEGLRPDGRDRSHPGRDRGAGGGSGRRSRYACIGGRRSRHGRACSSCARRGTVGPPARTPPPSAPRSATRPCSTPTAPTPPAGPVTL
jgi:(2R)-ethylmalonyl-CoA mutase